LIKKIFQNSLGLEFRKLRKRTRLTQASVATTAGISFPAIRKLERGLGNLATWTKALDALGWTLRGRNLPPGDSIGRQIAILRKRQKLSQRSLATMSGLTHPTIVGLEVRNTGRLASVSAILTVLGAGPVLTPAGEKPSFYKHAGNSSAHETWATPGWLLDRLHSVFGRFDLDPCSATKDRRLARVKARAYFTAADDGLSLPWSGTVFLNPPYGRELRFWTAKARTEFELGNAKTIIALVPARTDTGWWHNDIAGKASIFFLKGSLSFGDGSQPAPFPSALIIWGLSPELAPVLRGALPEAWCP
jgi:phage N-6-adenine-methyltransferase